MRFFIFSAMLAAVFIPSSAFPQETRNCPAHVVIQSFENREVKGSGYFSRIIQDEFASVFQGAFGPRVTVFKQAEAVRVLRGEAKRQEELNKTICNPKLYPPDKPMPDVCAFSKEAYEKIASKGDFVVDGDLSQLGNQMVFNATLVIASRWHALARWGFNFTGAPADPGVQNTVRAGARAAADKFAAEMVKYFYCVENDPKKKEIDFDKPEERKVQIESKVRKLSGEDASGLSASFSNEKTCCADVSPKSADLSGGRAQTMYEMKKKTEEDSVRADVTPDGGVKTTDVTAIHLKEGKLCLQIDGKAKTTISVPEAGGGMKWDQANTGTAELRLNRDAGTIKGEGKIRDTTKATLSASEPPAFGHGATPGSKDYPLTVTGVWVKDGASRLHIEAANMENFEFHLQAIGQILPTQQAQSSNFVVDIAIPYEDGAKKTESKTMTPYPGIVTTYEYNFELKKCEK